MRLTTAAGWQEQPTWSPDGKQIAYTDYSSDYADINVMNADGSQQRDITNTTGVNDTQPSWSAAGIAFRSLRSGVSGIYLMRPDGSGVHRLSAPRSYDEEPNWSRDGKHLVEKDDFWANDTALFTTNPDGGKETMLVGYSSPIETPSWQPVRG